jgi:hypothetical protein
MAYFNRTFPRVPTTEPLFVCMTTREWSPDFGLLESKEHILVEGDCEPICETNKWDTIRLLT